jgi:predicted N-acyltransferase
VTFPTREDWEALGAAGFLQRAGQQYHWENRGYATFEDFLAALNSRKRKQIRRERRDALGNSLEIETLTGSALEPRHWDAFYRFYRNTVDHRWGGAYLTRGFFDLLHQRLADRVVLVMARDGQRYVAGALNLLGSDTLYGRNWGCIADHPFLHFEVCYYRAIDFAIERGLARVEAGAQGQHKIQRGYLPTPTYSAHWVRDRGFTRAIENFLERERAAVAAEMDELTQELSPFRREDG